MVGVRQSTDASQLTGVCDTGLGPRPVHRYLSQIKTQTSFNDQHMTNFFLTDGDACIEGFSHKVAPEYARIHKYTNGSHSLKFDTIHSNTNTLKFAYFPRTIGDWNVLEDKTVTAPSALSFKERLKKQKSE